ncbi:MAG: glycoside hydrolase family 13 protein [Ruminococcaceae bacterium]|nr:glycoside hydrolase family 13 protein [Oscillospiraceae bacterium]
MSIIFDSRSRQCKEPFGCVRAGEWMSISIYIKDVAESHVLFLLAKDGQAYETYSMTKGERVEEYQVYHVAVQMKEAGLYFYSFCIGFPDGEWHILRDAWNRPCYTGGQPWQVTCYHTEWEAPTAFYGKTMYQILPDRFYGLGQCDVKNKLTPFYVHQDLTELPVYQPNQEGKILNNDFYGGNLAGIKAKLSYLHNLGVRILYLNPIFLAYSNHRYDTADYMEIDPMLGTQEDFISLCEEAHSLGIKIILDGVFSHTGSDSRYFDKKNRFGGGAYHDPQSVYRSWYEFQSYPHAYTAWWGIDTLPCVCEENPDFMKYILYDENSVVRHWLNLGADGWRLDVADELPDGFLQALYTVVKETKKESLVIGEVWEDASNKISYGKRRPYLQGACLDSVMNYVWREAIIGFVRGDIKGCDFHERIMTLWEHYPSWSIHSMMNILSTHDTPRILTALSPKDLPATKEERSICRLWGDERMVAKNRLSAAVFLQFTLPGCPTIYYGDEIGMEGYEDPFNRCYMGDMEGDKDIRELYVSLARLRNESRTLQQGQLCHGFFEESVYGFYRVGEDETILCLVNVGATAATYYRQGKVLYTHNARYNQGELFLLPYGSAVVRIF